MSLTQKSDEEISDLLAEYGIKHGPIVESTRKLYEKKLEKVMKDAPVRPSSDKTYYREEEEEVTYITYSPVRHEGYADKLKRRGNAESSEDKESDEDTEPPVRSSNRTANHSAVRYREPAAKSGGCMRKLMWLLLLAAVAAVFYYAFHVLNNKEFSDQ